MLSDLILWSSIALESAVLFVGLRSRLTSRFPLFYVYIAFVLFQDLITPAFEGNKSLYKVVYWSTEFSGLLLGSLVVFEICKVSLRAYPGTARVARNALAFVFLVALAKGFWNLLHFSSWELKTTALEIERALRTVQAAAILSLLLLFLVYSIPFGRNLRGILLGYGLFVGERVICLTFVSQAEHNFWFYAYSASYPAALGLWLAHLWSYQPTPEPNVNVELESDYQRLAAHTRRRLQDVRGYVRKAVRS
jgi:hypothetical protein